MKYYRYRWEDGGRLAVADEEQVFDITAAEPQIQTFRDLLRASTITDLSPDAIASRHINPEVSISRKQIEENSLQPVVADEIWAAGVTYRVSEEAREAESKMPEMYLEVYDAERPEIFFKATPDRTVGPGEAVGIRPDSDSDVPEPELGVVLFQGQPVGYTIGNDMSSRSIEGENPLYLPQAKIYDRCCSIGPSVVTGIDDPHSLDLSMDIYRSGERVYQGQTNTSEMVRSCDELVSYFTSYNTVPELSVLLTGTSLVPDLGFTLREGDRIDISVESIGMLQNSVKSIS